MPPQTYSSSSSLGPQRWAAFGPPAWMRSSVDWYSAEPDSAAGCADVMIVVLDLTMPVAAVTTTGSVATTCGWLTLCAL